MNLRKIFYLLPFLAVVCCYSCKDAWDAHTELVNTNNKFSLSEQIASEPQLTRFNELLLKTGIDKVTGSGNVYTIWAPDNITLDSLMNLYPAYFADSDSLSSFVKNHIVNSSFPLSDRNDTLRLETLNGKFRTVIGRDVEESVITTSNIYTRNGVLHMVHGDSRVKLNISEILNKELAATAFVSNLNLVNSANEKWAAIRDTIKNDSLQFTYFVLSDQAYEDEYARISPFYTSFIAHPDSTTSFFTKLHLYRDVIVKGLYLPDNLPDTLTSIGGVKIPVQRTAIKSSYRASNGIIYVVDKSPYRLKDRIKGFKIEGESWFARLGGTSSSIQLTYRTLKDTSGALFTDFYSWSHRISNFYVTYSAPDICKATYRVYARSVSGLDRDPHNKTTPFIQRHWGSSVMNPLAYTLQFSQTVDPVYNPADPNRQYREVYLGTYEKGQYGLLLWMLMGANVGTDNEANMINLDYVRFEPVLPN